MSYLKKRLSVHLCNADNNKILPAHLIKIQHLLTLVNQRVCPFENRDVMLAGAWSLPAESRLRLFGGAAGTNNVVCTRSRDGTSRRNVIAAGALLAGSARRRE